MFISKSFLKSLAGAVSGSGFENLDGPRLALAGAVGGVHPEIVEAGGGGNYQGARAIDRAGHRVPHHRALLIAEEHADGAGAAADPQFEHRQQLGPAPEGIGVADPSVIGARQ